MKILIVDDEKIVLDSCRRILESGGFEVRLAASYAQALEILNRCGPPALLLIDLKMPGLDGIDLMRAVRKAWESIPIILMSGYCTPETIAQAAMMGAATFIAKPFTPDELVEKINRVMEGEVLPVFAHTRKTR